MIRSPFFLISNFRSRMSSSDTIVSSFPFPCDKLPTSASLLDGVVFDRLLGSVEMVLDALGGGGMWNLILFTSSGVSS